MEWPSGAAEATSLRPQVIGHPSGSPRVEVVSSSSGGVTLADSKVMKALMIMQSCYNSDATMTVCRLAEVRERFYILGEEVNGSCSSRPALPPPPKAPIEALGERSTYEGEKHLGGGGGELPKKKTKVAVSKRPRKVAPKGTSERAHRGKGKELVDYGIP
ncbi:hypothetical protein BHM03_00023134 [Ensete ventricosum]|nr:hypothetical protein BHM03_00023134 [Ensete ventricosum]